MNIGTERSEIKKICFLIQIQIKNLNLNLSQILVRFFQKILNIYWDKIVLNLNSDFRNINIDPGACQHILVLDMPGS